MSRVIITDETGKVTGQIFITDYDPLNAWIADVSQQQVSVVQVKEDGKSAEVVRKERPKQK